MNITINDAHQIDTKMSPHIFACVNSLMMGNLEVIGAREIELKKYDFSIKIVQENENYIISLERLH